MGGALGSLKTVFSFSDWAAEVRTEEELSGLPARLKALREMFVSKDWLTEHPILFGSGAAILPRASAISLRIVEAPKGIDDLFSR